MNNKSKPMHCLPIMARRFRVGASLRHSHRLRMIENSNSSRDNVPSSSEKFAFPIFTTICVVYAGSVFQQHQQQQQQQQQQQHPSFSRRCNMDADSSRLRFKQNRKPPEFGVTLPKISTARGIINEQKVSTTLSIADNRDNCPMCKKLSKGPCGDHFTKWLACTDEHPGMDKNDVPLHLHRCSDFAEKLAECFESNHAFYTENSDYNDRADTIVRDDTSMNAWKNFVIEIEDAIKCGKYSLRPFPSTARPRMEVRPSTQRGAAYFVPSNTLGQPLLAAYIIDDSSNVIAAASGEDMYMNEHLGCVLQFKLVHGMQAATCRAIYDTDSEDIVVYTRYMLVPVVASGK